MGEVVENIIREAPTADEDIRKTPTCWLELCGHHHDVPSYGGMDVYEENHFGSRSCKILGCSCRWGFRIICGYAVLLTTVMTGGRGCSALGYTASALS